MRSLATIAGIGALVVSIAAGAFAYGGMGMAGGWGGHMMGPGYQMGGGFGPGYGPAPGYAPGGGYDPRLQGQGPGAGFSGYCWGLPGRGVSPAPAPRQAPPATNPQQ